MKKDRWVPFDVRYWTSQSQMSLAAQNNYIGSYIYIYLITPPTGSPTGCWQCDPGLMQFHTGVPQQLFVKGIKELEKLGVVSYDASALMWFVPKAFEHNPPSSHYTATAYLSDITGLPDHPFRDAAWNQLCDYCMSRGWHEKYPDWWEKDHSKNGTFATPPGRPSAIGSVYKGISKGKGKKLPKPPRKHSPLIDLSDVVTASFHELFWPPYPRKAAKAAALTVWEKLMPDSELLETILAALGQQLMSKDWTKDNGAFIPYPSTWLNGRRWEDEVAPGGDPSEW